MRTDLLAPVRRDVMLADGRALAVYDSGFRDEDEFAVVWFHGSPQTGAIPDPVLAEAADRNLRVVSYARPSYGGSTPHPRRSVSSSAPDVAQVTAILGLERFAVLGASGGGPHALAAAALLPDRVIAAATFAAIAPMASDLDFFDGMVAPGGLEAAVDGPEARERFALADDFDPRSFVDADWAALEGDWAFLARDVAAAEQHGPGGLIADDLAFVAPWGFDPSHIAAPVLVVQGTEDRVVPPAHGRWLADRLPASELWLQEGQGHVSVLLSVGDALDWMLERS